MRRPVSTLSPDDLQEWLYSVGELNYRSQQIIKWVHQGQAAGWNQMSNLPASLQKLLNIDFIDITKLENRELNTFWGHEVHYPDPEYGVSIMVPILPEAGFTPKSTIQPMTEMEMRYQREKREEKFPEPGPLGEKGWFVNISAYFRLDEWNPKTGEYEEEMVIKTRRKMFDFIEDVLTFNFLVNLKIITGNLKAASPATKKLFKDPDLNKFYNNMLNELVERSGSLDSYLKKYKIANR